MDDIVQSLAFDGANLIASGEFLNAESPAVSGKNAALWNGYHWRSFNGGMDARDLALLPAAEDIYVGGRQQYTNTSLLLNGVGLWVTKTTTSSLSITPAASAKTGASVTLTAALAAGATGTVTFLRDGTAVTSCIDKTLNVGTHNVAAWIITSLALGSGSYTAVYTGDGLRSLSTSSAVSYTILKAAAINLTFSPVTSAAVGTEVTLTASVNSDATGTVAFQRAGAAVTGCSAVTVTAGSAQCKTSLLAAGTADYTAEYSGDAAYAASTSSPVSYTTTTTTTTLTISPAGSAVENTQVTLTAAVTAGGSAATGATGTVAFKRAGTAITGCSAAVGDEVTLTATINSGLASPAALSPYGPLPPGATVAFKRAGTAVTGCSAVTVTANSAQCVTSALAAGTAEYSGDLSTAASTLQPGQLHHHLSWQRRHHHRPHHHPPPRKASCTSNRPPPSRSPSRRPAAAARPPARSKSCRAWMNCARSPSRASRAAAPTRSLAPASRPSTRSMSGTRASTQATRSTRMSR